ncbi:MAG: carboxylating nicotinate-nucleotide diphosphorylase [Spirochaetes bacterium]|nr:carboxylating nicotinate-nucleotide diphosphorylase [Spirochaetota bacterium]
MADADEVITRALTEDIAGGDITTDALIPADARGTFALISKDKGVLAGIDVFTLVFKKLDKDVVITTRAKDGDHLNYRDVIATITGSVSALLKGERTALNLLQHLSGIAGKTAEAVETVKDYQLKILDTRKTIPGIRRLQKYAVCVGGGYNHRLSLNDMFLIKDNHIKAAGGIREAFKRAKSYDAKKLIEIETATLDQVREAFDVRPDVIMLDNMDDATMKAAKDIIGRLCKTEASGNVTAGRLITLARLGVDYASIGALTHSVRAHDFSLKMQ